MLSNPQLELAEQYLRNTNVSIFLTGKAGTGKTTFLRHIVETIDKRHVVVAPTGVAAINAGGVTIHSQFQLPFCPYLPDVKELVTEYQMPEQRHRMRQNKINVLRSIDLLIIDEISMVRADLLDAIDNSLRHYRRSHRPFGGVQLLMIGDLRQLPPVVTDDERPYMEQVYPSPFFFNSKALQKTEYITIQLSTIYRQQDQLFVNLLNNIRDNNFDQHTLDALNARYIPDFDGDGKHDYIRLTTHNRQADSINGSRMEQLKSRTVTIEAEVDGVFPDSSMPVERTLQLKEGEQVMFVKNDSSGQHRYYNGKIGVIESIEEDRNEDGGYKISVTDQDGECILASRETWENMRFEVNKDDGQINQIVDGTFKQFPLRPAWAITIHKAQGLTFDNVIIDAADAFSFGQVYVALSRCRSLEGLVLSRPISSAGAIASLDILSFDRSRPSEQEVRDALPQYEARCFYDMVFELFDVSGIEHNVEQLSRLFGGSLRTTYPKQMQTLVDMQLALSNLDNVTARFRNQLMNLSAANATDSQSVQQRISQGAEYYKKQLLEIEAELEPILDVEIDNKETRKDVAELKQKLQEQMTEKKHCLQSAIDNGFSVDSYNHARIEASVEVANKPKQEARATSVHVYSEEPNSALIAMLSRWRKQRADEMERPAFVVLHQKVLLAIASSMPSTPRELLNVPGMGKKKVEQYGREILEIIAKYKSN